MRHPSLLVPVGAAVAAIGIYQPILTVGAQVPGATIPVVSDLVDRIPETDLGASTDQQLYLLAALALAVAAWLLPRIAPRAGAIGIGLAVAAAAITAIAAGRGWIVETGGPEAVVTEDSSFLGRFALDVLQALHERGVLVVHPGSGLWLLTVGAAVLLAGVLLALRPQHQGEGAVRGR